MKILWVKPGKLLPLDTGGKLRTYNILRHLAASHELTYLSYYNGKKDELYEHDVQRDLPGTVSFAAGNDPPKGARRHLDYLLRLSSPAPYAVSQFVDQQVKRLLCEWIPQRRFNVAVCDFLASTL